MNCLKCGSYNPGSVRFCGDCGARLANRCTRCEADNPPGKRFCADCGMALAEAAPAAQWPSAKAIIEFAAGIHEAAHAPEGERKTVTALFADIKGSTELMEDLDPEEARAIVDPALRIMVDAVRRYEGYVVQSTGDGIFALFGAPAAYEDHPQRALYAALRMQEELRGYGTKLQAEGRAPVEIRIGVNTGEVVVRPITTGATQVEYTPIGHTTNLASRLQSIARTGSIVASESMRKLCAGYFILNPLGATKVKGVSEPINVYEVMGLGPLRTRLQRAVGRGLTRFVGREAELAQMRRALESAREGHGQMVAAMGEPGVGKSRLFFEFKAVAQSGWLVLDAYSVPHGKASAYLPVIELLRDYFRITPDNDARQRREKVIGKVLGLDRSLEDALPYVFALLGIQQGDDPLAQMDAQIRRRRTQEALKRILLRESLNQPLIVVFEDLHWIDNETQALLKLLADSIADARILLLVNYRPEYRDEWGHRTHYTQLRLDPLGAGSAEEMLTALLTSPAPAALSAGANRERPAADMNVGGRVRVQDGIQELRRFILDRTQGNPFFMEEIVQALFDEGVLVRNGAVKVVRALSQLHLPPTVQGILAARIDRLPSSEKDLLQTLAVIGREFALGLVSGVSGVGVEELEPMLAGLQLGEFIYEQPAFPDTEYIFKHALTHEVAYNSVLMERRKLLHGRTGAAMESLYATRLEDHLDELAHHYSRSENVAKAVEYLRLAAAQALGRSHYDEANAHAAAALNLIGRLPDGAGRLRAELALQFLVGQSSMATLGYGGPEVEKALGRAEAISRQIGSAKEMFGVLAGLCTYCLGRGEHRRHQELATELLQIARQQGSSALLAEAYFHSGHSQFYEGQFAESLANMEHALSYCQPGQKTGADIDLVTMALYNGAHSLWALGYADKAREMCDKSLERAASLNHPASIAVARMGSCLLRRYCRQAGGEELDALDEFSNDHGFLAYTNVALMARSVAWLEEGSVNQALTGLSEAIERSRTIGTKIALTIAFCFLSEAYLRAARPVMGVATITQAFAEMVASGERFWEPELHRVKGELLFTQDALNVIEAEQSFRTAIEVARRQEAKSLELRATTSLARLLSNEGRREEARSMLAEIYHWFTEGLDTADLKDARALLDGMAARP